MKSIAGEPVKDLKKNKDKILSSKRNLGDNGRRDMQAKKDIITRQLRTLQKKKKVAKCCGNSEETIHCGVFGR